MVENVMREAVIKTIPNYSDGSKGPDVVYMVELYINDNHYGTMDVRDKSIHYANDVVENWENGILGEDNEHIIKPN
jgi:hypothetical protein